MAVITAAVVAVSAAVAATTVASVATAVVAVSVAIGTVGAVVGAVGAAIGNKDLMFAGQIMGYVGLAGGLAGGVMGGLGAVAGAAGSEGLTFGQGFADTYAGYSQKLAEGWNKGVGSWFSGGDTIAGAAGQTGKASGEVIQGGVNPLDHATGGTGPGTPFKGADLNPINRGAVEGLTPTVGGAPTPTAASPGAVAPTAGTVNAPNALANMNNAASWTPNASPASTGGLVESVGKTFSDMPDWMKYSMMTTGAQGITGLASGYFQGEQAGQQLAQKQQQLDRDEAQRQLLNRQANEVPLIQFQRRY